MDRKLNMLAWCDSPLSITGFGVVAKNILGRIHSSGAFKVACVGINHLDEHIEKAFEDRQSVPYKVFVGMDFQQNSNQFLIGDRMARGKVCQMLKNRGVEIDAFFTMRDLWDMCQPENNFAFYFPLHIQLAKEQAHKNFRVISHFPLEYKLQPGWRPILDQIDYGYCFTQGGMSQLEEWKNKIEWAPQGADHKVYFKIPGFNKNKFKAEFMRLRDPNSFVVLNVNRNQPRKDITSTIKAFKTFKDSVQGLNDRKVVLWLHMKPDDNFGDARRLCQEHGLIVDDDVQFPPYFNVGAGWAEDTLNMLYNACDVFVSTSVAEGFGLTPVEAGMAGTPVLVPGHTGFLQTVGHLGMPYIKCGPKLDAEAQKARLGTLVSESEVTLTDTNDLADQLIKHYKDPIILERAVDNNINQFRKLFNWDSIFDRYWVPLLETVREDILGTETRQKNNKNKVLYVCDEAFGDVLGATKALDSLRKTLQEDIAIDFMTKNKFKDVVKGNPNIANQLDWDLNKLFDYPPDQVFYPHTFIRHSSWAFNNTHLLDMQAEMIGLKAGEVFIQKEEFDTLLPELIDPKQEVLPYITINTTSQAGKMITADKWIKIIQNIGARAPYIRFLLVGGPNDFAVPGTIDFRFEPGTSIPLSYRKMAWLQSKAFCHIGIDSGPGHCADAVETPSLIMWGWTNVSTCKPQNYSINIVPHYPTVCPRMGPCHGVSPGCGINQYHSTDGMRAPCIQSIDVTPIASLVTDALTLGLSGGKKFLKEKAKKLKPIYALPPQVPILKNEVQK